jgi:hypothetical protein
MAVISQQYEAVKRYPSIKHISALTFGSVKLLLGTFLFIL